MSRTLFFLSSSSIHSFIHLSFTHSFIIQYYGIIHWQAHTGMPSHGMALRIYQFLLSSSRSCRLSISWMVVKESSRFMSLSDSTNPNKSRFWCIRSNLDVLHSGINPFWRLHRNMTCADETATPLLLSLPPSPSPPPLPPLTPSPDAMPCWRPTVFLVVESIQ